MTLSVRRAKDRIAMAEIIARVVRESGFEAEIRPGHRHRSIVVEIRTARDLLLSINFDGDSPLKEDHVLSWHMDYRADPSVKLSPAYWPCLNMIHFHKATDVACGFDGLYGLVDMLKRRLEAIADGRAFQSEMDQ